MKKTYKLSREPEVLRPDLCIIGAGSAGLSVAAIAASFGASVVLVEKSRMGGECLNVGCVPSKALIAAAQQAHAFRHAERFGIGSGDDPAVDFAKVHRHVKDVIAAIAPMDSVERYTAMGVQVIQAEASFTDGRTVTAGGKTIQARRFVIASGSRPAVPPIPGLDRVSYFTNDTIFDLAEKPEHLVVIGGGAIGVELAQAYRRLGARVTVLEAGERILSREDPEMAAVVERALRREGVALRVGSAIARIEPRPDSRFAVVIEEGESVEGSHLLVATGRQAVTEGLGLEAAGVGSDPTGILVGRDLKTSNARIYAIGDCVGGDGAMGRFTHAANHQAGLVIRNALFRLPIRWSRAPIPRVTYTDPELAAVGLTEEEAKAAHKAIRILRWSFADNDRARAEGATEGHVKAVVTPRGRILGCAIAGRHAGELIMPWVMALSKGSKVSELAGLVYPYPTLSEVTKGAAVEFLKPSTQNPWLRRLIGLVRRLG
ncbi:dihydrolipoyl dehydrogenase family protein [Microvirga sp. GCM10011540]|uniref:dihydrolipoyl dehydrogenase family protein n=1 Tax=Microvirga sp. GCM10011540 TaxID=3317338 RepID=UPI0036232073